MVALPAKTWKRLEDEKHHVVNRNDGIVALFGRNSSMPQLTVVVQAQPHLTNRGSTFYIGT